jgi:hypothetical protein
MLILAGIAACTPAAAAGDGQPAPSATAPQIKPTLETVPAYPAVGKPGADGGVNLGVLIEGAGLVMSKTDPAEALLVVTVDLPTPCHSLSFKVALPDINNQIKVSLAILPPARGSSCTQNIQSVRQEIPLGKPGPGKYTVLINGQQAGSIVIP